MKESDDFMIIIVPKEAKLEEENMKAMGGAYIPLNNTTDDGLKLEDCFIKPDDLLKLNDKNNNDPIYIDPTKCNSPHWFIFPKGSEKK